jgi:hypothetical protein
MTKSMNYLSRLENVLWRGAPKLLILVVLSLLWRAGIKI